MNLIQQAEHLKNLPDQALSQMTQGLTSTPPYLVVAEMQRRESMRKSFQAQNDPVQGRTVVEEMRDRFNPAPQAMPPGQPPPGQPPQAPQPMAGAPPMRMANGGLASLKRSFDQAANGGGGLPSMQGYFNEIAGGGGGVQALMGDGAMAAPQLAPGSFGEDPAMTSEQLDARYGVAPSIEEVMETVKNLRGKSRLEGIADELAAQEKAYRSKKPKLGETMMELGLAMAASRRPDLAGAIGEGGLQALHGYRARRELDTGRADLTMRQRLGVAEAMQHSDDVATGMADNLHRANTSSRNTDVMTIGNARRGMQADKSRERINDATRASQQEIEGMKEKAAERRYRETFDQTTAEKQKDRDAEMAKLAAEIKGGKYRDHSGSGAGNKDQAFLLKFAHESLMTNRSSLSQLYKAMENASPEEKAEYRTEIKRLEKQNKTWLSTLKTGLTQLNPNLDLSALEDSAPPSTLEAGPDAEFIFDPASGGLTRNPKYKAAQPKGQPSGQPVDRSESKGKAGVAMMNSLPGLQTILGALPGAASFAGAVGRAPFAIGEALTKPRTKPHPDFMMGK